MNVLVSGASGFIGRNLVSALIKKNYTIHAIARSEEGLKKVKNNNIKMYKADISSLSSLKNIDSSLNKIDVIFHLAAMTDFYGNKKELFRVNVDGTVNFVKWGMEKDIKRFVYISSIESMGPVKKEDIPAKEDYPCRPVSIYGMSKLIAENFIIEYCSQQNLDFLILRLGNVIGVESSFLVLPIANAIMKKNELLNFLPVYRDIFLHPVYVEEAVEGIVKAGEGAPKNSIYTLTGKSYVTVGEIFKFIANFLGTKIENREARSTQKIYLKLRGGINKLKKRADLIDYFMSGRRDRIHRAYSIEKAKREIGFIPLTELKDSIWKILNYYKKNGVLKNI